MISPKAVRLIIRHFDAIDHAVSKRLVRKRPWHEPALTSLLCDLLDAETQQEEKINYSISELNKDLSEIDGLLSLSFTIETHEYDSKMERWITQADLGLLVKFEDELLPSDSWTAAWLLQAKRLSPARRDPITYTEACRFAAMNPDQHARMERLQKIIGISFVRFLLYCPRPSLLDATTALKLMHLRNRNLGNNIFDFTLGLELHEELSSKDSSLSAGLFVTKSTEVPPNLGYVHAGILEDCFPFSWFLASHLVDDGPRFQRIPKRYHSGGRPRKRPKMLMPDSDGNGSKWAEGIVTGDSKAVECLIETLDEQDEGPFPVLPPHTLTVRVTVGHDLDPEVRRIRHE